MANRENSRDSAGVMAKFDARTRHFCQSTGGGAHRHVRPAPKLFDFTPSALLIEGQSQNPLNLKQDWCDEGIFMKLAQQGDTR